MKGGQSTKEAKELARGFHSLVTAQKTSTTGRMWPNRRRRKQTAEAVDAVRARPG